MTLTDSRMQAWFSSPVRFVTLLVMAGAYSSAMAHETRGTLNATSDSTCSPCATRNDEVWLISTRNLCYQSGTDPTGYELDVRRQVEGIGWQSSSLAEFLQLPPLPLVIFVHGNRIEWDEAFQVGWQVYGSLAQAAATPPRMRFVIWTWPSDQLRRPLRDIRLKAGRADEETYFFGGFLSQLAPVTPVGLVGYSYGARIIGGGLHLLAGGTLGGIVLKHPAVEGRIPARVVLVAPAMDNDLLCPGNCHGAALEQVDNLLVLYNSCDPALQRYRFADRYAKVEALGYVGLPWNCLGSYYGRVEQLDAAPWIGRTHDIDLYFSSAAVRQEICRVLFDPLPQSSRSR